MGRVHNQQFQGTTLLIVFDFLGNVNKTTLQVAETGHISGNNKHSFALLKFNIAYLKNDGWNLGFGLFSGAILIFGGVRSLLATCSDVVAALEKDMSFEGTNRSFPTKSVTANVADKQLGGNIWGLIIPYICTEWDGEHLPTFYQKFKPFKVGKSILGGGFNFFVMFILGEMIQLDEHIFQMGGSTTY